MAREYTLGAANQTVLGATTLLFLNPKAGPSPAIEIIRLWCGQSANATSAQQRIQVVTQVTAFPTLVGATPQTLKRGDPVSAIVSGTAGAAGTCGVNASAEGAGTKSVIWDDTFNVLNGWLWVPTPNETIILQAGATSGLGLWFPTAPTSLSGWTFGCNFRELG
jgi:hypothetical protein